MATKTVVTPTKATTRILLSEMVGVVKYIIIFAQFLLYLKKITYLCVDYGRSWHLHALHINPDQPEGRVYQERIYGFRTGRLVDLARAMLQ